MNLKRIGLDTSKAVFTVHGVDHDEKAVLRRNMRRTEMEAFFAKLAARPFLPARLACLAAPPPR
jgi:transposase